MQLVQKIGKEFWAVCLDVIWVKGYHFLDKYLLCVNTVTFIVIFIVVVFQYIRIKIATKLRTAEHQIFVFELGHLIGILLSLLSNHCQHIEECWACH